jgi:hypothetical protein
MTRINVYRYDEPNSNTLEGWFDTDKSERIEELKRWDGNNLISLHTNDQFTHQALHRTAGGRWVLNRWSQWQGSPDTYEFITDEQAREWLLINEDDEIIEKYLGEVEEERGPGRPEIGPAVNMRFPQDMLDRIDAAAKADGISRAEKIRRLVSAGI